MKRGFAIRKEVIILSLILILSFIVILFPIRMCHFWDEAVYLQHAKIISGVKEGNFNEFDLRPPVMPLLFSVGFIILNEVYVANIITALIGAIGVLTVFLLAKELFCEKVGLISSLFLALAPFFVSNSSALLTDVPGLVMSTIAVYFYIRYEKYRNNTDSILSGIFLTIAILTKFTSFVTIFIFISYSLIMMKKQSFSSLKSILRRNIYTVCAFIITILPYLIWSQIEYGSFIYTFLKAIASVSDLNAPFTFYILNFANVFPPVILIGFFVSIILFFYNHKKKSIPEKSYLFLITWLIIIIFFLSIGRHKEMRYFLPAFSSVVIMSAWGFYKTINHFRDRGKLILIAIILAIIAISTVSFYWPVYETVSSSLMINCKTEEMEVANFIMNYDGINKYKVIYTNFNYPVFAYYTNITVKPMWIWNDSFYEKYNETMDEDGIMIIYKNLKYPGREWADNAKELELIKEFPNILVYKYDA